MEMIKNIVTEVLREDPRARDNDTWLILQSLRKMGFNIYIDYTQLNTMPSFETITRVRRDLQNKKGLFPSTKQIQQQREANKTKMQQAFSPVDRRYDNDIL